MFWITLAAVAWNEKRYSDQDPPSPAHWLRIAIFLANWLSVMMCLYPLYAAADILGDWFDDIPSIGDTVEDIVENLAGAALCVAAFLVAMVACGLVFGLSWVYYNQSVYGYVFLGISGVLLIGLCVWRCTMPPSEKRIERQKRKGIIAPSDTDAENWTADEGAE